MNAPHTVTPAVINASAWLRRMSRWLCALAAVLVLLPAWQVQAQENVAGNAGSGATGTSSSASQAATGSGAPATATSGCSNTDSSGTPSCGQEAGNPINVTNGNKYQREVDMPALPGALGLELVRHYNSSQSRPGDAPGMFGRGWRLSYDWNLRFSHSTGNETLILVKGDGTEVGLAKRRTGKGWDGTWWPVGRPDGRLEEIRLQTRTEYLWTALSGQRYRFSERGFLMAIEASSGEVLRIERESKGDVTRVTDPQGRELRFELLSDAQALRDKRFGGAQAVITPVGRYEYRYGGEPPAKSVVPAQRLLSRLVSVEHAGIRRAYLYEDTDKPGLLTGIQVIGKGSDGVAMNVRIATWAYDRQGRAFKSIRGEDKTSGDGAQQTQGKPLIDSLERVTLQFLPVSRDERGREAGSTLLTNSLGQNTLYRFVKIQGRAELTEVIGPGCASCGETNVRNVHDSKGVLLEVVKLAPVAIGRGLDARKASQVKAGEPLESVLLSHDESGRPIKRERRLYLAGKPQAAVAEVRLEYGQGAFPLNWLPASMARPSVIEGREYVTRISYNARGQTLSVEESGFSPAGAAPVHRKVEYRYDEVNGHSVLGQIDGPLPNGSRASPEDSDITRISWDSRGTQITATVEPGGFRTSFQTDVAGRMTRRELNDGFRKISTELRYLQDGRHALSLDRRMLAGEILSPGALDTGRFARIQPFEAWYDALGRMTRQVDAAGREVHREYDNSNRLSAISDAQGNRSRNDFDGEGHMLRTGLYRAGQPALSRASYVWHDEQGRLKARLLPDGRLDTWTFDERGDVSVHVDGDDVRTTFMRSKDGMMRATVRQATDGEMEWSLARSVPHARGSDDFGRKVEVILPDHGNKQASYDEAGRIIEVRRADHSRIEFRYDVKGRLVRTRYVDGEGRVQSEANNRYEGSVQVALDDNELSTHYIVDALGRRLGQAVTIKALNKAYRFGLRLDECTGLPQVHMLADGRLLEVRRASAREGRTVSALQLRPSWVQTVRNRMSGVLPAAWVTWADGKLPSETVISNIEVDPLNGLSAFTMGNGLKTQRQFDTAGRLIQQTTDRLGTLKYGHEVGPRIREITTESAPEASPQPTVAKPYTVHYDYTGFGRLKVPGAVEVPQASLSQGAQPKAVKANISHASWPRDALGRTTEDDRYRFSYTIAGQLYEVHSKADNHLIARYRYDSQSRRVSKTVFSRDGKTAPTVLYFLWQDQTLVGEIDAMGEVTTHYLYLKEGGPAQAGPGLPIAKLVRKASREDVLFVHSDHRGAPKHMTTIDGRLSWSHGSDLDAVSYRESERPVVFNRNELRLKEDLTPPATIRMALPGQWTDEETGLRDNLFRTFSPKVGRYLQPDPMSGLESADAYGYAGGDPLNKSDPLGLYEIDVHYYMTFFLARIAGLNLAAATTVATAAQYVDNNPNTEPMNLATMTSGTHVQRLAAYHFTQPGFDPAQGATSNLEYATTRMMNPSNPQLRLLLEAANRRASTSANPLGITACARAQLFGEYLHALEDTFGHRSQSNAPIDINLGLGHALYGHEADKTYYSYVGDLAFPMGGGEWKYREARTFEMEREVFSKIQSQFGSVGLDRQGFPIEFAQIADTLREFNSTPEDEVSTNKLFPRKLQILNDALARFGMAPLPPYSAVVACGRRKINLRGLSQSEFPGTILATPDLCI